MYLLYYQPCQYTDEVKVLLASSYESRLEKIIEDIKILHNLPSQDVILIQSEVGRKFLETKTLIKHYETLRDKSESKTPERQPYKDKARFYKNVLQGQWRQIEEEKILTSYLNDLTKNVQEISRKIYESNHNSGPSCYHIVEVEEI